MMRITLSRMTRAHIQFAHPARKLKASDEEGENGGRRKS